MHTYYLRTTEPEALRQILIGIGAILSVDGQTVAAEDGCWDVIGTIYRPTGTVVDGVPTTTVVSNGLGMPYWHANLTTAIDLDVAGEAWGNSLARWFVVDQDGQPTAPEHPFRMPAGWAPPVPPGPPSMKPYIDAVDAALNNAAKAQGYDGIVSACSYAGAPNYFQAESVAFLEWRAACWVHCHQVLAQVQANQRPVPTPEDLVAELPALELPT